MHRHYLTFAHEAALLDAALSGWGLAECWSQQKNVLLLHFVRQGKSGFVEIDLDANMGYALPARDPGRARKNTIDFFPELVGAALGSVTIHDHERALFFNFNNDLTLVAFFFGRGSGNVLLLKGDQVLAGFQKRVKEYLPLLQDNPQDDDDLYNGPGPLIEKLLNHEAPPVKAITSVLPVLGKRLAAEALLRCNLQEATTLKGLSTAVIQELLAVIDALYLACRESHRFYVYHREDGPVLALTELDSLARGALRVDAFDDIPHALRAFRSGTGRARSFSGTLGQVLKRLHAESARAVYALKNKRSEAELMRTAQTSELYAELLTARLYQMNAPADGIRLADLDGAEHDIPLDPKLSPAQNAAEYYRRARKARQSLVTAADDRQRLLARQARVAALLAQAQAATDIRELERIMADNKELFASKGEKKEEGTAERFRRFVVAGGLEVYAGKSAANNDELTVRFARPNDYWFHARGSSGSHVILRWNDSRTKPSKDAIRQAAAIAAYYSGARNAKMVPVAYTLKKYVRKPRGAAPGAVIMERESVVMAEPKLPQGV